MKIQQNTVIAIYRKLGRDEFVLVKKIMAKFQLSNDFIRTMFESVLRIVSIICLGLD